MRILRKIISNLQTHIITIFSTLLFLSFAMIGLVFNIAVNRYIAAGASGALEEARAIHLMAEARPPGVIMRTIRGNHRFFDWGNVRSFSVDNYFEPSYPPHEPDVVNVAIRLKEIGTPLAGSTRIRVHDQVFFVNLIPLSAGYRVLYLEVTEILMFAGVVNRLLLILVTLIWLASMIIAALLADSLVRPLRLLRDFVRQIGRGDFTPNTRTFANEEFEELNQSLNHAAKQLASYDNDQKTFFQNVSHELRTPLMSIKSYAEGIKYGIMEPADASNTILEAADKLAEMVGDILYVSRIDNLTAPAMERANLCFIAEERVNRQRQVAEGKSIKIGFVSDGEPVFIMCAMDYMERVIDNLISNAMRYAKSAITVECYAIGSRATLRVIDDGPGFEPSALPHVFERFYRGKNGLTGIGLAIVKSIIDQHKGTATAENGEGKGAVLTISLPKNTSRT